MGVANYINRLADWIDSRSSSATATAFIVADLEYLGRRLDAADSAGQKGAHGTVDRVEASRYIVGTYLLLGDLLRLAEDGSPNVATKMAPEVSASKPPSNSLEPDPK